MELFFLFNEGQPILTSLCWSAWYKYNSLKKQVFLYYFGKCNLQSVFEFLKLAKHIFNDEHNVFFVHIKN